MDNKEIYCKTMKFSIMSVLCSLAGIILLVACPVIGFMLTMNGSDTVNLVGTVAGLILGIVFVALIAHYASYLFRAGQIAMMAQGIVEGSLPEDVYAAGRNAVKARFGTVSAYFAITAIISGISNEVTRGLNSVTAALDGQNGTGPVAVVGDVLSIGVSLILTYLNYCCLGWVFIHKDQNAFKSTCDGAVIYFQNWKALLKNAGLIFGISLASLVVVGGAFTAIAYFIFSAFPVVVTLASELAPSFQTDGTTVLIVFSAIVGIFAWSGPHSAFVKPLILVNVMRRYIETGLENPPRVDIYGKLCGMSKKFKQAFDKAKDPATA